MPKLNVALELTMNFATPKLAVFVSSLCSSPVVGEWPGLGYLAANTPTRTGKGGTNP